MRLISLLISIMLLSGCAKSWYLDEWTVSDVKFASISALSAAEARKWLGSEAVYSKALFSFRDESCQSPQFRIDSLTASGFQINYRASFSDLGIEGDTTDILKVTCDSSSPFPGDTLIKSTANTSYIPWDGTFFRLERIAP